MTLQPSLESTQTLLARARQGDRAAREVIAGRYLAALRRFAHGRLPEVARGLVDTEDLVQVAVVRTLNHIETLEPGRQGSLLAYLRQVVLNQIRDEIRKAARRPAHDALHEGLASAALDPLDLVISRESAARYEAALARLPAEHQEAFMLRVEMGCGYREIGEALGRPSANAARMLVRRAIAQLAEELQLPVPP